MRKWRVGVGVLAICLSTALVVIYLARPAQPTEADAVKMIRERGGHFDKERGSPITAVHLGGTQLSDADLSALRGLKQLTALDLEGTQVTDAGLKELKGFEYLTSLNLKGTRVTDCGLRALADLRRLNDLQLPRVTDATLHTLAEIDLLHALSPPGSSGGRRPTSANEVRSLTLLGCPGVTDDGLKAIKKLSHLTSLDLAGLGVTDNGLNEIRCLANLTVLNLYNTRVTAGGLRELRDLKQLATLYLSPDQITNESLGVLIEVGLLHTLPDYFQKEGDRPRNTNDVHTLILRETRVTDAGLWQLMKLPRLVSLDLRNTHVTDDGLRTLYHNQLTSLDLSNTVITDAGLKEIKRLTQLTALKLNDTKVTDACLKELLGLTKLRLLEVNGNVVTDRSLKSLADAGLVHALWLAHMYEFERPKSDAEVRSLNLYDTAVTDAGLRELHRLRQLNNLRLREDVVTDAALKALYEIGLLHALDRAEAEGGKRPMNVAEVRSFHLANSKVTTAGEMFLQKALPGCELLK